MCQWSHPGPGQAGILLPEGAGAVHFWGSSPGLALPTAAMQSSLCSPGLDTVLCLGAVPWYLVSAGTQMGRAVLRKPWALKHEEQVSNFSKCFLSLMQNVWHLEGLCWEHPRPRWWLLSGDREDYPRPAKVLCCFPRWSAQNWTPRCWKCPTRSRATQASSEPEPVCVGLAGLVALRVSIMHDWNEVYFSSR